MRLINQFSCIYYSINLKDNKYIIYSSLILNLNILIILILIPNYYILASLFLILDYSFVIIYLFIN